jgi:hypothetical protein
MANRPQTLEGRRENLSDRMSSGRDDRQGNRGDRQDDRQDWRDNNREDWQDFANENRGHHGGWYNDCWHGNWSPGAGWDHMWDHHPVAAVLGVTRWGINRLAYGFGYWGYSNPWYGSGGGGYSYSEPLVVYSDNSSTVVAASSDPGTAPTESAAVAGPPQPTDEGMAAFENARAEFLLGHYENSLTLLDTTLQTMPQDTVVHEFRGLVLFALKRYPESAAAIYAVLSAGPGWDWTTLSGLYLSVDDYTQQLRELESFSKSNPMSADGSFLLGYHYLTMGHQESANKEFVKTLEQLPGDKLLTQLVDMTAPAGKETKTTPPTPPAPAELPAEKVLSPEQMVGTWKAVSEDARFELQLSADGAFVWTYTRGESTESVKGVFAVDQNNLAMEPNAGGTMLAEIDFSNPAEFLFRMFGGEPDDPGLKFTKS